jgi:hypothetical protein
MPWNEIAAAAFPSELASDPAQDVQTAPQEFVI